MVFKYIVEHMEPELDEWSEVRPVLVAHSLTLLSVSNERRGRLTRHFQLEYANIRKNVGDKRLYLTHVHPELLEKLPQRVGKDSGIVSTTKAVQDMEEVAFEKVLLLDPSATQALEPQDGENFEWLLFGGILVSCAIDFQA